MRLTAEQLALRDAVRGLLASQRGRTDGEQGLWRRLCDEIGVAGLGVPERFGGAGAGPVETSIVMEELGRLLTPAPMLGSAVLAAAALLGSDDAVACQRLLPAVAGGAVAALAWTGPGGHWDPAEVACRAAVAPNPPHPDPAYPPDPVDGHPVAAGWVLDGEAHHVLDGDAADMLIVAAATPGGTALFEVAPGQESVTRTAVTTMDSTRRLATVRLAGAAGRPIGGPAGGTARGALAQARDLACVALAAEQVGAAGAALEMTVAYTKVRMQFGRAIGGFQALQHRLADLHVLVESARSLCYAAATAAAGDTPDSGLRASAAKVYCSEALQRVAAETIQMHGAIGVTWEHDAHRYLKRAHGSAQLFGQPGEHTARIAATLIDQ